jgi:hypothetical protein
MKVPAPVVGLPRGRDQLMDIATRSVATPACSTPRRAVRDFIELTKPRAG